MGVQDDRILPATKWLALVVVLVLLPALVILWGLPGRTADLWAWTIKPNLTPIFMGAGYGAGAYFFVRVFRGRRWHEVTVGVLGAAIFATLMLVTTAIHYDKFNHGHGPVLAVIAFYGWVIVYIASPFLVGGLWFLNQRLDPGTPDPGEAIVPRPVRRAALAAGVGALAVALAVLLDPHVAIDNWGWKLTPLTARVLACFTAQVGVGALMLARDARWTTWKILVETFLLAVALLLIGAARAWSAFDTGNVLTWAYVIGLVAAELGLAGLYVTIERARRGVTPPPAERASLHHAAG